MAEERKKKYYLRLPPGPLNWRVLLFGIALTIVGIITKLFMPWWLGSIILVAGASCILVAFGETFFEEQDDG